VTSATPPPALEGARVAVMGASGGLGSAITHALAASGARPLLAGRAVDRLRAVGIAEAPIVQADVRDPECGTRIAEAAVESFGGLDGLVNAAGIVAFGSLAEHDDDTIEELFDTARAFDRCPLPAGRRVAVVTNAGGPGIMATDMTSAAKEKYDRLIAEGLLPQRRWGTPEDVGRAVRAILAGLFPYTTGDVIHLDGGFHIRRL